MLTVLEKIKIQFNLSLAKEGDKGGGRKGYKRTKLRSERVREIEIDLHYREQPIGTRRVDFY